MKLRTLVVTMTVILGTSSMFSEPNAVLSPRIPQGLDGGFWRVDNDFDPVLRLKNILQSPLDSTRLKRPIYCLSGEREFFELRLIDLGSDYNLHFLIREIHAAWSDPEQRIKWDGYQDEVCSILEEAQQHFAARRAAIVAKGFNCSNI